MARFFTSDHHYSHQNVIKYCPLFRERFATVHDMNVYLTDMWNNSVRAEDEVFFLGDFAMKHNIVETVLPLLNGRITFISGNHDKTHTMMKGHKQTQEKLLKLCPNIVEICDQKEITIQGYKILLSHFPWKEAEDNHSEEHNSYVNRYTEWKPSRQKFPKHILLHGHKHSPPDKMLGDKSIDVGFDAWGRMITEEDILQVIRDKFQ